MATLIALAAVAFLLSWARAVRRLYVRQNALRWWTVCADCQRAWLEAGCPDVRAFPLDQRLCTHHKGQVQLAFPTYEQSGV